MKKEEYSPVTHNILLNEPQTISDFLDEAQTSQSYEGTVLQIREEFEELKEKEWLIRELQNEVTANPYYKLWLLTCRVNRAIALGKGRSTRSLTHNFKAFRNKREVQFVLDILGFHE